ncbi:MAG: hypothetical protein E4G99_11785 [Anaerolineales bacterium]|nr:MAG: hypothetical protein E4G99_11785 [Anaerolineales bacterium]
MDPEQIEKRLAWLDEQHRKAEETIKQLGVQLKESNSQIAKQSAQISDLNAEISRLAGTTTRIHQIDETLQKHRKEVARLLESAEKRRTEKETNLGELRKSDQKAIVRRIDQVDLELERLTAIEQVLETRQEEDVRLSKQITKLEKNMEKLNDESSALEEQLKSVTRTSNQLQKEMPTTVADIEIWKKKIEELSGMLQVHTETNRTLDVRINDLMSSESERSEGQARWIERQELNIVELENVWKKWGRRFDAIEQQAGENDQRLAAYEEMHRSLKQMRTELTELMERLERRITEVSEMQRLSESRMKHEWSAFQAEDLKRWNTYKLSGDELWRDHVRLHDRLAQDIVSITNETENAKHRIGQMTEAERQRLGETLSMLREWISEFEGRFE